MARSSSVRSVPSYILRATGSGKVTAPIWSIAAISICQASGAATGAHHGGYQLAHVGGPGEAQGVGQREDLEQGADAALEGLLQQLPVGGDQLVLLHAGGEGLHQVVLRAGLAQEPEHLAVVDAVMAVLRSALPVSTIRTVSGATVRAWSSMAMPSMPGMVTSDMITANGVDPARSESASAPLAAVVMSNCWLRSRVSVVSIFGSSSTHSTLGRREGATDLVDAGSERIVTPAARSGPIASGRCAW